MDIHHRTTLREDLSILPLSSGAKGDAVAVGAMVAALGASAYGILASSKIALGSAIFVALVTAIARLIFAKRY